MTDSVTEIYNRYSRIELDRIAATYNIHNGSGQSDFNALAHAMTSAAITFQHGSIVATVYGEGREVQTLLSGKISYGEFQDNLRDLFNNRVGIGIASYAYRNNLPEGALEILTVDALNRGLLVVNEFKDSRVEYWGDFDIDTALYDGASASAAAKIKALYGIDVDRVGNATGEGMPVEHPDLPSEVPIPGTKPKLEEIVNPHCFPASTPIQTSITTTTPISELTIGDTVLSFDPSADLGRGALVPRRITQLFRNVTTEWLQISWQENGETRELISTPNHHFLDELRRTGDLFHVKGTH